MEIDSSAKTGGVIDFSICPTPKLPLFLIPAKKWKSGHSGYMPQLWQVSSTFLNAPWDTLFRNTH